ncbi:magnesium-translocating P-type ATPase [Lacrimispora sphenoides]|uniref:Magnesium-transporting ATPase, P-type 1 n=1 Tax=Lacrimispora sphenoides JCM 1415 TaxID=1297793 RepID=A0ABY1C200_9FIRM|nr:magnesium-translocating P-type ATPase [Lacrimispora sphenoides]SET54637.1 Mg2+-importing ATPase [[Clostridium] sphenoides JCM 1415]SUY49696.1 magnesium-translocating P-type ATPase [Lacrimispora sphenoides]
MQKVKNNLETLKVTQDMVRRDEIATRLKSAAAAKADVLFHNLNTTTEGLSEDLVDASREQYGDNKVTHGKKVSLPKRIAEAFINPFTAILIGLTAVSAFTDIILADPGEADPLTVVIIMTMVLISGILRFVQETRSGNAADKLLKMIKTTTNVRRMETGNAEIPLEEVVVGDIVHLAAGDMIPADMRIIQAKDLFVSQSALTGESVAVEKIPGAVSVEHDTLAEYPNLAFMGSNVISGSAAGVVVATGDDTIFGDMAKNVSDKPVQTNFEKGVNSVSWLLIRFMLVMVPIVLFINGFTKGDWMQATLFALSIAVGLTPEMLPMIVTTCLAKGAVAMSKEKTIIKNLNSIQNLGSIDILCTDKTGTLTQDKVALQYHLNIHGEEDTRVLRHAFLNSYYQTGLKNLMDVAVIERTLEEQKTVAELRGLTDQFTKVDEIPFDFERRRMSVVVKNGKTQMITKGAVEEMLSVCSYAEYEGKVMPLTDDIKAYILKKVNDLNEDGMRVIAVAQKTNPSPVGTFSVADESDMVLMGYLAFLDPPKESTAEALAALKEHGVDVKILTGDNDKVTRCVCRQVGLSVDRILLGSDLDNMSNEELGSAAERVSVFAKLSPQQKARVITILRNNGHSVGYMGDGINDAAAMKASDVGISVDTAVDIAKESADVILLEKDLMVLEKGIIEGRKTYANMIKYIKMTASSNFGNMFSVLAASAFLPFIPMLPIHLILLNLIYDLSCTAIPWDNVDKEYLAVPRKWDASSIGKFMIWIGPTSSVFDITTYLLMYFIICPAMTGGLMFHQLTDPAMQAYFIALFQAGWFVESMWSQTLVIHMIRTPKIPFIQSHASLSVTLLTFTGIAALTIIPFTKLGASIGLAALPPVYFAWLALTIFLYMVLATVFKKIFIRRYGELL